MQPVEGRRGRGEKGGTREDGFLGRAPPSSCPSSPPLPPSATATGAACEAGARFYDDHGEGQGGAYVHHDDTGKTSDS